jgi:NADH dehydrogenase [ubiquinone] 1 alpha subcomplex assembly factor 7
MKLPENKFIPLDDYVAQCNAHYYAHQNSIGGNSADFITAPEISQMFGEIIGAWCAAQNYQIASPQKLQLIELGPGRGTLMADILRILRKFPDIYGHIEIHLVETSPRLRAEQEKLLSNFQPPQFWHDDITTIPHAPFILIANEFFDALPIRQFTYTALGWHEVGVVIDHDVIQPTSQPAAHMPRLPPHLPPPVPGNRIEFCPAMLPILQNIHSRLLLHPGRALIIDYGYGRAGYGDTLQAIHHHQYANPFENAGKQDLTAHVNFEAIGADARAAGVETTATIGQGDFLRCLGIEQRAEKLLQATDDGEEKLGILEDAHRLTAPDEMGTLFKVICLSSPALPPPEGF